MSEHTKEPWKVVDRGGDGMVDIDATPDDIPGWDCDVSIVLNIGPANARRIVACVNACSGIDTEFLERTHAEGYESGFRKHIECEQQRDKMLEALKYTYEHGLNSKALCTMKAIIAEVEAAQ